MQGAFDVCNVLQKSNGVGRARKGHPIHGGPAKNYHQSRCKTKDRSG